jgi:ribosome-associated protein
LRRIVLFVIWSRKRWKRSFAAAGYIRRIEITSEKLATICGELASNKKAEDIVILDLREISTFTDFFVICSATSEPHLKAIAGEVETRLKEDYKISAAAVDGFPASQWIVLDYLQVVVHVFHRDKREFYSLEDLWGDAPRIELESGAPISGRR